MIRREFLLRGSTGAVAALLPLTPAITQSTPMPAEAPKLFFNVRDYGTTGDGHTLNTPSVNRAIDAARAADGGTVVFLAGTYACTRCGSAAM